MCVLLLLLLLLLLSNLLCVIDFECGKNVDFHSLAHLIVINSFDYMLIQITQANISAANKIVSLSLCVLLCYFVLSVFFFSTKFLVEWACGIFMTMRLTYDWASRTHDDLICAHCAHTDTHSVATNIQCRLFNFSLQKTWTQHPLPKR